MVDCLAGVIVEGEGVFFPLHFSGVGDCFYICYGVTGHCGQAVGGGVLEDVYERIAGVDGAGEFFEEVVYSVCVVVVVVCYEEALDGFECAFVS